MITLALVDDQRLIRVGLGSVLASEPGMEIVGEAATGAEAIELCRQKRPDVVLMDIEMPEMDGLAATRRIKEESPRTSVVVLTSHEDPNYLLEAIASGAAGYLLKEHALERVAAAVRRVASGESPLDQELAMRLLRQVSSERRSGEPESGKQNPNQSVQPAGPQSGAAGREAEKRRELLGVLTAREREILSLVAEGRTNQQIAEELFVGIGTVKTHVHRVIAKLGVSDRTQVAVLALRLGLTDGR